MRILLYTYDWMPLVGGVQTITMSLTKGLAEWPKTHPEEPVSVTLVTETPAGAMDDSLFPFRVVRQPSIGNLIRLVRAADVIHIAGPAILPMILALTFRKPTVVEHHGYQSICPNGELFYWPDHSVCPGHFMAGHYGKCVGCNSGAIGWRKSFLNLVLTFPRRWLARAVCANVVPSCHIRSRISLPRTQLIYHGIPKPERPIRASVNEYESQPPCFAYVGRLIIEKGLPVLLHASRQLADAGYSFRLKIIGDGPERHNLEKLTEQLGLSSRTQFVGSVPVEDVAETLLGSSVVVMPSLWEDVAPLVAIEQMAQGRLVIASDIGGLGEEVDGVGLKFPPGDAVALASCMRQVIEHPYVALEMGQRAGKRAAESFTEHRMMEEHLRLYQKLEQIHRGY
jgi:glycosyltransferase involved in cell wall biosynthesis